MVYSGCWSIVGAGWIRVWSIVGAGWINIIFRINKLMQVLLTTTTLRGAERVQNPAKGQMGWSLLFLWIVKIERVQTLCIMVFKDCQEFWKEKKRILNPLLFNSGPFPNSQFCYYFFLYDGLSSPLLPPSRLFPMNATIDLKMTLVLLALSCTCVVLISPC